MTTKSIRGTSPESGTLFIMDSNMNKITSATCTANVPFEIIVPQGTYNLSFVPENSEINMESYRDVVPAELSGGTIYWLDQPYSGTVTSDYIGYINGTNRNLRSVIGKSSGKWYFEARVISGGWGMIGIGSSTIPALGTSYYYENNTALLYSNGTLFINSNPVTYNYGVTFSPTQWVGVAADLDNNTIFFVKDGTSYSVKSINSGITYHVAFTNGNDVYHEYEVNFGQMDFSNTAPEGYIPGWF